MEQKYKPGAQAIIKFGTEDLRAQSGSQGFVADAPLNLIFVSDYERITGVSKEKQAFQSERRIHTSVSGNRSLFPLRFSSINTRFSSSLPLSSE